MEIGRVYVIGMGEVGSRLAGALETAGTEVVPVTRDSGWNAVLRDDGAVRLACVREEALPEVLERLRPVPGHRIALVQNGWIRPLVENLDGVTRGLIWFTAKGDFFRVLRPSPFGGPLADALATRLSAGGIPATAVDRPAFDREDAEKMGFNCVVGLPLAVHGESLGDYLANRRPEAREVFDEAVAVSALAAGTEPDAAAWSRFLDLTRPLHWVRTSAAKALEYRNGAIVRLADRLGADAPANRRLLAAVGFEP